MNETLEKKPEEQVSELESLVLKVVRGEATEGEKLRLLTRVRRMQRKLDQIAASLSEGLKARKKP